MDDGDTAVARIIRRRRAVAIAVVAVAVAVAGAVVFVMHRVRIETHNKFWCRKQNNSMTTTRKSTYVPVFVLLYFSCNSKQFPASVVASATAVCRRISLVFVYLLVSLFLTGFGTAT